MFTCFHALLTTKECEPRIGTSNECALGAFHLAILGVHTFRTQAFSPIFVIDCSCNFSALYFTSLYFHFLICLAFSEACSCFLVTAVWLTNADSPLALEDPLYWKMRLDIALNSAQGLEYLHGGCTPNIIHRDVKSSNILLTDKYVAKMADFGISRLGPETGQATHVSTQVIGTLGYLDPE